LSKFIKIKAIKNYTID